MNRKRVIQIVIIIAIVAALVVGVRMLKGAKADLPKASTGD